MKSKSILSTLVLIVMISYVYPTVATKQTVFAQQTTKPRPIYRIKNEADYISILINNDFPLINMALFWYLLNAKAEV